MRVVIGEDLFLLREGLVRLLTAHGFEIVAARWRSTRPPVAMPLEAMTIDG